MFRPVAVENYVAKLALFLKIRLSHLLIKIKVVIKTQLTSDRKTFLIVWVYF